MVEGPVLEGVVVEGVVVEGDKRGRLLGFPTANVCPDSSSAVPSEGVYAGIVELEDGTRHRAAISIGRRPQYHGEAGESLIEAHLLDFDGDLYATRVRVEVGARLRDQAVFKGSDELVAQIARDVATVAGLIP